VSTVTLPDVLHHSGLTPTRDEARTADLDAAAHAAGRSVRTVCLPCEFIPLGMTDEYWLALTSPRTGKRIKVYVYDAERAIPGLAERVRECDGQVDMTLIELSAIIEIAAKRDAADAAWQARGRIMAKVVPPYMPAVSHPAMPVGRMRGRFTRR
jgi:hypothetical protein